MSSSKKDAVSINPSAGEQKDQRVYTCSACSHQRGPGPFDWFNPRIPVWNPKKKKFAECSFKICPLGEGPNSGCLLHPELSSLRFRRTLTLKGEDTIRICVEAALWEGKSRTTPAILQAPPPAQAIWHCLQQRYLVSHGPDDEIDLAHLNKWFALDEWRVHSGTPSWCLPPAYEAELLRGGDRWSRKAIHLDVEAIRMAATLACHVLSDEEEDKRILYVGIDIADPIAKQVETARSKLIQIQKYLKGFVAKPRRKPQRRNLWRDVYLYLLREKTDRSVADIADEVFPGHDQETAKFNVRQIVRRVRKIIRQADKEFRKR